MNRIKGQCENCNKLRLSSFYFYTFPNVKVLQLYFENEKTGWSKIMLLFLPKASRPTAKVTWRKILLNLVLHLTRSWYISQEKQVGHKLV